MLPEGLWCALADLSGARVGSGLSERASELYQYLSQYLGRPAPRGLLSSLSGMEIVISVSLGI